MKSLTIRKINSILNKEIEQVEKELIEAEEKVKMPYITVEEEEYLKEVVNECVIVKSLLIYLKERFKIA